MDNKPHKTQKLLIGIGIVMYMMLAVLIIAQQIEVTSDPVKVTLNELSPETQKGIEAEAKRSVLSVEEFVDTYVVSTTGAEVEINKALLLILCALIGLPLYYLLMSALIQRVNRLRSSSEQDNDTIRTTHLHTIQKELHRFFEQHSRFPSEDEYVHMLNTIEGNLMDPKHGKTIRDNTKDRFGYYYNQYNPVTQRNEQTYYHLWCFLENGARYELTPQRYTDTVEK